MKSLRRVIPTILLACLGMFLPQALPLAASTIRDGQVELVVSVDRDTAQVVDPIRITMTVTAPRGTMVAFESFPERLGAFQVQSFETAIDVPVDGDGATRQSTATIVVDTIETGDLTIPPLTVQYRVSGSDEVRVLRSEPIAVRINSLLEDRIDPNDFRDIKSVMDIEVPQPQSYAWAWWTAGGLATASVLAAGVLLLARRTKTVTPAQWALAEIDQLDATMLSGDVDADAVYGELASVVNEFIKLEYSCSQSEALCEGLLPEEAADRLGEFMEIADQVRFAQLSLSDEQVRSATESVRRFVFACDQSEDPRREAA